MPETRLVPMRWPVDLLARVDRLVTDGAAPNRTDFVLEAVEVRCQLQEATS